MHFTAATILFVAASLTGSVSAHARLGTKIPGFLRQSAGDGFNNRSPVDPANAKLCKGVFSGGKPTLLQPGKNTFDLETEMAPHGGGSGQVSLSFDGGRTFKVLTSYIGAHPRNGGGNVVDPNQNYDFTIPANTKAGDAIFAWTWSNKIGNREFYMDCAPVTIGGSGTSTLNDRPDVFVSNLPSINSCKNAEGTDVAYPNPGPEVIGGGGTPPTGDCGSRGPAGGSDAPAPPPKGPAPPSFVASGCKRSYGGAVAARDLVRRSVTVKSGDTCSTIAAAAGTTAGALMAANPAINAGCTNLAVGQVLVTGCN